MRGFAAVVCAFLCGCTGSPESNLRKGDRLLRAGDFERARASYAKAVRSNRMLGPAYLGIGRAAVALGDLGGADDALRRAVELLPPGSKDADSAAIALADVYLRMDRHESRMNQVEQTGMDLVKRDPKSYDGRRLLGALALQRAELRHRIGHKQLSDFFLGDAEIEFAIANRLRPGQPEVMAGLARSLAAGGKLAEAEREFRALVALEPRNPAWYAELYRVLLAAKKPQEADSVLRGAEAAMPRSHEFGVMRAAQAFGNGAALDRAISALTERGAGWYPAFLAAGDFRVRAGDLKKARSVYDRCASQSPQGRESCRARMLALLSFEGKKEEALRLAREMLAENRDDVAARVAEARDLIDRRQLVNAMNELQSVVLHDPRNFEARYQLARVHMLSGEAEQARQQLADAVELHPDFIEAKLKLAQIHIIRGEFKGAMQVAGAVLASHPESGDAHRIYDYAERRVSNPGLRGLWGPATDNVRRLGEVPLVMEGDPSDAEAEATADRRMPPRGPRAPSTGGIYLRNTLVDEAIRAYRTMAEGKYDRFEYTGPVPGVWPQR